MGMDMDGYDMVIGSTHGVCDDMDLDFIVYCIVLFYRMLCESPT